MEDKPKEFRKWRRRHGLQYPLHSQQLMAWAFLLVRKVDNCRKSPSYALTLPPSLLPFVFTRQNIHVDNLKRNSLKWMIWKMFFLRTQYYLLYFLSLWRIASQHSFRHSMYHGLYPQRSQFVIDTLPPLIM